jgi:hypothetical protein
MMCICVHHATITDLPLCQVHTHMHFHYPHRGQQHFEFEAFYRFIQRGAWTCGKCLHSSRKYGLAEYFAEECVGRAVECEMTYSSLFCAFSFCSRVEVDFLMLRVREDDTREVIFSTSFALHDLCLGNGAVKICFMRRSLFVNLNRALCTRDWVQARKPFVEF